MWILVAVKPFQSLHSCALCCGVEVLQPACLSLSLFQGGSHRASVSDDRDPFRFRHMIATDSLQVRTLASRSILIQHHAVNVSFSLASHGPSHIYFTSNSGDY